MMEASSINLDSEREKCREAGHAFRSPYRDQDSSEGAIRFRVIS